MTARTTDRLTWVVLAIAFLLLIAAIIGVIVWADAQINRWERRAVDAEAELADAREEKLMFQSTLKGLVEGTAGPMRGPRDED
jgi:uncharacterized iron-regulated membrane protein